MKVNKKVLSVAIVFIWSVFSIAYIANDIWTDFQREQINVALQSGYQQGVADMVNDAITSAENEKCEPFSMFDKNKGKNVEVINIKCLQSVTESAPVK
jgi:hypothetical protein